MVLFKIIGVVLIIGVCAGIIAFVKERIDRKGSGQHRKGFYERYIKRALDCMLATEALIVFSPVLLLVALIVRIKLGSPVIFFQDRPGKDKKIFKLYKFRTMTDERDESGNLLPDEVRLTPFGKKLRSTSLDELPELVNVLRGDMAVVGPRPLLVKYLPRYSVYQARRHEVRPGFTGLAQVHGRNSISWEDKFDWDVKYVDHISFLGDMRIIIQTIRTVLKREGISSNTSVTMEEFMGCGEVNNVSTDMADNHDQLDTIGSQKDDVVEET